MKKLLLTIVITTIYFGLKAQNATYNILNANKTYVKDHSFLRHIDDRNTSWMYRSHGAGDVSFVNRQTSTYPKFQFLLYNGTAKSTALLIESDNTTFAGGIKSAASHFYLNRNTGKTVSIGGPYYEKKSQLWVNGGAFLNLGPGQYIEGASFQVNGESYFDGWVRINTSGKGLYFQKHGGGFYMQDNTWIRTYQGKSIYSGAGVIRSDKRLQVKKKGSDIFKLGDELGNDFNIDIAAGAGLVDLVAGAYYTSGVGYKFSGTRGASRIRLHDDRIDFFISDKSVGTQYVNAAGLTSPRFLLTKEQFVVSAGITPAQQLIISNGLAELTGSTQVNGKLRVGTADDAVINQVEDLYVDGDSRISGNLHVDGELTGVAIGYEDPYSEFFVPTDDKIFLFGPMQYNTDTYHTGISNIDYNPSTGRGKLTFGRNSVGVFPNMEFENHLDLYKGTYEEVAIDNRPSQRLSRLSLDSDDATTLNIKAGGNIGDFQNPRLELENATGNKWLFGVGNNGYSTVDNFLYFGYRKTDGYVGAMDIQSNGQVNMYKSARINDGLTVSSWGDQAIPSITCEYGIDVKPSGSVSIPDYVFEEEYDLRSLSELRSFIKENGHLPGVINKDDVAETGKVELLTFTYSLLEKIEENTLYTLQQEDILSQQTVAIVQQSEKIQVLENELAELKELIKKNFKTQE